MHHHRYLMAASSRFFLACNKIFAEHCLRWVSWVLAFCVLLLLRASTSAPPRLAMGSSSLLMMRNLVGNDFYVASKIT